MEIVYIYSLSNPISNEVRYIGKSTNIENRYKQHIGRCKKEVTHKCSWIKNLQTENLKPKIEIVDLVESGEWQFWEKYWISQFKSWGFDLVNSTDGGDGILLHSDFTKKYMSNDIFYLMIEFNSIIPECVEALFTNGMAFILCMIP